MEEEGKAAHKTLINYSFKKMFEVPAARKLNRGAPSPK
jgi:hypothetical protein